MTAAALEELAKAVRAEQQLRAEADQRAEAAAELTARMRAAAAVQSTTARPEHCQLGGSAGCTATAELKVADSWGDSAWGCPAWLCSRVWAPHVRDFRHHPDLTYFNVREFGPHPERGPLRRRPSAPSFTHGDGRLRRGAPCLRHERMRYPCPVLPDLLGGIVNAHHAAVLVQRKLARYCYKGAGERHDVAVAIHGEQTGYMELFGVRGIRAIRREVPDARGYSVLRGTRRLRRGKRRPDR